MPPLSCPAQFNAPNYGPIGPPSRLGSGRAPGRGTRALTSPSSASNTGGSGAARVSNAREANLYATLMDLTQGRDDDAGGDAGAVGEEHEKQRGAKL